MAKQVKDFLFMLSDSTFLNSIQYVDFAAKFVKVKRDFWNHIISEYEIRNPARFAPVLKDIFILRLHYVHATQLKMWFCNNITGSFIDFINVSHYYINVVKNNRALKKKLERKDLDKLRSYKYFEKKGYNFYIYTMNPEINEESDAPHYEHQDQSNNGQDDVPDVSDTGNTSQDGDNVTNNINFQNPEESNILPQHRIVSNYPEVVWNTTDLDESLGDFFTRNNLTVESEMTMDQVDAMLTELQQHEDNLRDNETPGDRTQIETLTYHDIIQINEVESLDLGERQITVVRTTVPDSHLYGDPWDNYDN
jgi:hypothetical protein